MDIVYFRNPKITSYITPFYIAAGLKPCTVHLMNVMVGNLIRYEKLLRICSSILGTVVSVVHHVKATIHATNHGTNEDFALS